MSVSFKRFMHGCLALLLVVVIQQMFAATLPVLPPPNLSVTNDNMDDTDFTDSSAYNYSPNSAMTLRDAVLLALRMNPDVRSDELERVVQKFSLAVAHNQYFEPQYSLTGSATYARGSSPVYAATPGVSITTPYGTNISTNVAETFNGSAAGTVTVTQPLLQGFGKDVYEANWYGDVIGEENNKLALKANIITVIVNVVSAYQKLVQDYQTLAVDQQSLQDQETQLYQTNMKVKAGKVAQADAIQQSATLASSRLSVATDKNNIFQDTQALLMLLGLDPNAKINIEKNIHADNSPLPSLQESINLALAYNTQYQTTLNNYKIDERSLITAQDAQKWTLNATATLSRDLGSAGDASSTTSTGVLLPSGTGTTKSLAFNLTVPIHSLSAKQTLVDAKIKLEQDKIDFEDQRRTLISDVINAYTNLESQREQIKLAEENVKLQQQSLQIEQIKYTAGRSTPLNLSQQRTSLTQAQLNLISQQIGYINTLESFYQTLGITLKKWKITLIY